MLTIERLQQGVVIPFDKPRQWTSFQAVGRVRAELRRLLGLKKFKIGHAGTLDPLATGLLLICAGRATKQISELQDGDKVYSGTIVLGATTLSHDLERPVNAYYPASHITLDDVKEATRQLTGAIMQTPPLFSAVKIDGQRAYEVARESASGVDNSAIVGEPRPKQVTVYEFSVTRFSAGSPSFAAPAITDLMLDSQVGLYKKPLGHLPVGLPEFDFRICSGKGTYIRSIARDIGAVLGCGAVLSALRRERIGSYDVASAVAPDGINQYLLSL